MAKHRKRRMKPNRSHRRARRVRPRSNPGKILGMKPGKLMLWAAILGGGYLLWKSSKEKAAVKQIVAAQVAQAAQAQLAAPKTATGDDMLSVSGIFESAGGLGSLG